MNIDIAESMMNSWLRHCQQCQIVQTNWNISNNWEKNKEYDEKLLNFINENNHIQHLLKTRKKGDDGKKTIKSLDTMFKQFECDLFGISYSSNRTNFYLIEVAYHNQGLHYNNRNHNDHDLVLKKILLPSLAFYRYVLPYYKNNKSANLNIIFATPNSKNYKEDFDFKIYLNKNDKTGSDIRNIIKKLYGDTNINVNIEFYKDKKFDDEVSKKILSDDVIENNNIKSELFLRSIKLKETIDKNVL